MHAWLIYLVRETRSSRWVGNECHIFTFRSCPISESRDRRRIFLSILKPWVEPHRAKSPNQPGIKSFPSTALDDRQRAAPFCIASYSPRINSVRNAGGNFFDDHQSLVYFLSTSHGNPSAAFSDESIGLQLHCAGY